MWELVSFVRRGGLRTRILESLLRPSNPTDLAKKLNSHRPTVSMALSQLQIKKLVKRINPNEKNISIYGLTPEGVKVLAAIKGMKMNMAADAPNDLPLAKKKK